MSFLNQEALTSFEILSEWGRFYRGWIVPVSTMVWDNPQRETIVLSLSALKNILQSERISRLDISTSNPMFIRINFFFWPYEDYVVDTTVEDWLLARSDAARNPHKICWLREGF
jgi:hypothetical protein